MGDFDDGSDIDDEQLANLLDVSLYLIIRILLRFPYLGHLFLRTVYVTISGFN